ncbi:hypothetical protein RHS01_09624 [Rhizoctonia solani]|uniref:Uncharacterized protein n=1 Tax=Rhizoctonia solani TaxID=456999 RepID=A0A8H7I372_9AGAM|nr:hypothetical protein RHS01_09624 [Rhizoctonia solani]
MEPEPSPSALLEAITALTATIGPYRTKSEPRANKLSSSGPYARRPQTSSGIKTKEQPKPSLAHRLGLSLLPPTREEKPTLQARGRGRTKATQKGASGNACKTPGILTPFDAGSSVKRPKMDLPDPYKGDTRGRKATQWLDRMMLWVALHRDQFDEEEEMVVWILYHMTDKAADWALPIIGMIIKGKAFADPDAKRAAARKIAALTQTTPRLIHARPSLEGERTLVHQGQYSEDNLEAIFAASVKIDNTCRENEENRPKKLPAKSRPPWPLPPLPPPNGSASQRTLIMSLRKKGIAAARLAFVSSAPERAWDQTMSNGWKATIKEAAKIGRS